MGAGMGGLNKLHQPVIRFIQLGLMVGLSSWSSVGAIAAEPVVGPQNNVHLYGEARTSNQLGKQYVIFTQSGQQIVGALYSPQSEYSCFIGQRNQAQLNVHLFEAGTQVIDSSAQPFQVQLPTLKAINAIGPTERQVLASCQQEAALIKNHAIAQSKKGKQSPSGEWSATAGRSAHRSSAALGQKIVLPQPKL